MTVRIPKPLLFGALAVLLTAAAGVGGYFIGFAAADRDGAYARGEAAGRAAGRKDGETRGRRTGYEAGHDDAVAEHLPGTPAYKRIFNKGRKAGIAAGRAAGYTAGNADAFAGFDGGWEIGRWYMVHFGQPVGDERYSIDWRVPMETGESYAICPDDVEHICSRDL